MSAGAAALRWRLSQSLGARAEALAVVVAEARRVGVDAFLVGGPVRDLLLERPISDIDVLLSGRLDAVAKRVGARIGAEVVVHSRFLTAKLETPELRLDLSRARRERYARAGALPEVEPASVEEDLGRRDFAIHAIALPLDERSGSEVVDPLGGCDDLAARRLRSLHERSFIDDPTRLLRAARYSARLRFRYAPATRRAMQDAVRSEALGSVSGDRIRQELARLLEEDDPARAVAATERAGLFEATAQGWVVDDRVRAGLRRFARAASAPPWPEAAERPVRLDCGLRLLVSAVAPRNRLRVIERLGVRGRPAQLVRDDLRRAAEFGRGLSRAVSPGRLDARLGGASDALLLLTWCSGAGAVARHVARYADRLRKIADPLGGADARALGLRGPAVGDLLRAARERSLDGHAVDDAWLRRWLARHG